MHQDIEWLFNERTRQWLMHAKTFSANGKTIEEAEADNCASKAVRCL